MEVMRRTEVRIKYYDFQKMIEEFTRSTRDFTAFSSTQIDHIFWFYFKQLAPWNHREWIPGKGGGFGFQYSGYDTINEEAIFKGPPEYNFGQLNLAGIRVAEVNRPLEIRLLKP